MPNGDCDAGQAQTTAGRGRKMFGTRNYCIGLRGGGAAQAEDAALTTAEVKWRNGFATGATFEGEFSNVTRNCAGKGFLRQVW